MVKLISLLKRKDGLSREEFARWAVEEHAPIGKSMPGIRQYRINVLRANLLAMRRAVAALEAWTGRRPDLALVDGNVAPALPCAVRTIVKGDSLSLSIAAASVVAKVTRDRVMRALALRHPGYGWEANAGYATAAHVEAIRRLGVTPHHRRSFAPIREALSAPVDLLALLETGPLAFLENSEAAATRTD